MKMITKLQELLDYLESIGYKNTNYRIAVEGLIFTEDGRILLEKRGPGSRDEVGKLEGVGGSFTRARQDLLEELFEEFDQEIGRKKNGLDINVERLLEVRPVQFMQYKTKVVEDWIVVSYLCRLRKGTPTITEKDKIESLHYLTLDELYAMNDADLSNSTIAARITYRNKYGNRPFFEVAEESAA
jgi:hypothetical protein